MLVRIVTVIGVLAAVPVAGIADEVVLKNGSVLKGIVKESGDQVILELDDGKVTLQRSMIKEIRRDEQLLGELEKKVDQAANAEDYYETALWAIQHGLRTRAQELFEKVISLNPDHEGARRHLGYQKYEGSWLRQDELMAAKGFVRHEGEWITDETYLALLEARAKERLGVDRLRTEEELARLRYELARKKLRVQEERLEAAQRTGSPYLLSPYGSWWAWGRQ